VNLTDLLPLQTPVQTGDLRKRTGRPLANLSVISDAVEHSVSEALSLQLNVMSADLHTSGSENDAEHEKRQQMAVIRARLSKRQIHVLRLLGAGKTNKEMARALLLSPNTIKLHVSAILQRLKLRSRTHAALLSSRLNKQDWENLVGGDLSSWKKMRTAA
jgi:DNA-binding NarL/FixJ family response regulator